MRLDVIIATQLFLNSLRHTHTKKRGTFSVFLSQGVWRYLTNRITKSPRLYRRALKMFAFFSLP